MGWLRIQNPVWILCRALRRDTLPVFRYVSGVRKWQLASRYLILYLVGVIENEDFVKCIFLVFLQRIFDAHLFGCELFFKINHVRMQ
jgi:hypothetical protein